MHVTQQLKVYIKATIKAVLYIINVALLLCWWSQTFSILKWVETQP
jgi:hypothetical protein